MRAHAVWGWGVAIASIALPLASHQPGAAPSQPLPPCPAPSPCAVVVVGACLFPLAPNWVKIGVFYLTAGLLCLILATLALRSALALSSWLLTGRTLWLLPNVLSEVRGSGGAGRGKGGGGRNVQRLAWRPARAAVARQAELRADAPPCDPAVSSLSSLVLFCRTCRSPRSSSRSCRCSSPPRAASGAATR